VIAVMAAGFRDAAAAAHDLGQVLDDDVRESLDALGDEMENNSQRWSIAVGEATSWITDQFRKVASGAAFMWQEIKNSGSDEDGWMVMGRGYAKGVRNFEAEVEANRQARAERRNKRNLKPTRDNKALLKEANDRGTLQERIQEKIRKLSLNDMTPAERLKALEAERDAALGEMRNKPEDLGLQERVADLDLEIQSARKGIGKTERAGPGLASFDSLAQIGGFGQGVEAEDRQWQMDMRNYARETADATKQIAREGF
jgi:hypothetical protein